MSNDNNYCKFVFVYGTLRKGHKSHDILKSSKFVGTFTTRDDDFQMCVIHGVPYVFKSKSAKAGGRVRGEVYKVSRETAQKLDEQAILEKVSYAEHILLNGFRKTCSMYLIHGASAFVNENIKQHTVKFIDKPLTNVYDWIEWSAKHTPNKQQQVTASNKKKEKTAMSAKVIPLNFDPTITLKDGTQVNKDTLAYQLLTHHDAISYFLTGDSLTDEERGRYIQEEMVKIKELAVKISGVL